MAPFTGQPGQPPQGMPPGQSPAMGPTNPNYPNPSYPSGNNSVAASPAMMPQVMFAWFTSAELLTQRRPERTMLFFGTHISNYCSHVRLVYGVSTLVDQSEERTDGLTLMKF
jgi:hypothetical protein